MKLPKWKVAYENRYIGHLHDDEVNDDEVNDDDENEPFLYCGSMYFLRP